ncbi:hypothetical protein HX039_17590 [Myroides marinus]|uniref:hypothetical protein n=1 Tax=Myroides marinus TaxID=703342 RepID=UPI002576F349|nr:hypothetical protein [Myroides marinus]MDM1405889.1 hypothetical protein [Myroides marinus]
MNYSLLRFSWLFIIGLCLQFNSLTVAQETPKPGTQISDNTAPHSLEPLLYSILDLNSSERGFLMPRMSTVERMRIPTEHLVAGMTIYNTSIECIEFYNATRKQWMSACGDVEPAIFTIPDDKCNNIKISGAYAEGVFLNPRQNVITLEVSVSSAGSYQIEAVAYDDTDKLNGYTFSANGLFPSEGNFTVILKGNGTPRKGYPLQVNGEPIGTDKIVFLLNNKEVKCTVRNKVQTKALMYDLVEVIQNGNFYTGVNVLDPKTTGKIQVKINNISQAGTVEIKTKTQNGVSFSGRRELTASEVSGKQAIIDLIAIGVPTRPAKLIYDFISNSYVRLEDGDLNKSIAKMVTVAPIDVTADCNNVIINKEFKEGESLTNDHSIIVPVKVIATGRGRIIGTIATDVKQTELIEYASDIKDFVFNGASNDVMNVEMRPITGTGKPSVGGVDLIMKLQLKSMGIKEYDSTQEDEKILKDICDLKIRVKSNWAEIDYSSMYMRFLSNIHSRTETKYDILSGGQVAAPYIPPRLKMNVDGDVRFRIEISNLKPTSAGDYEYISEDFNGVIFKDKGYFSQDQVGKDQNIVLKAYGTSETDQPTKILKIYNTSKPNVDISNPNSLSKRVEVDYVYEPMVIYSIGGEAWHPAGNYNKTGTYEGGPALFSNDNHFHFKSDAAVRIDQLEILFPGKDLTVDDLTTPRLGNLNSALSGADIVFVGSATYNSNIGKDLISLDRLARFVNEENGVVISGDGESGKLEYLTSKISGNTFTSSNVTYKEINGAASFISNSNVSKLIRGDAYSHFGKMYDGVSLFGKNIAGGYGLSSQGPKTSFKINKSSLPFVYEVLAVYNDDNNSVFAFMHKTKGFVGVASSSFMGGTRVASSPSNSYPARSISKDTGGRLIGAPLTAPYAGGTTYNSWFILNLTHWGIDYRQKKKNGYIDE